MSEPITSKDYIDRSMDAVRAENDAQFAKVLAAIQSKPSTWQLVGAVFGAAFTVLGVVLAVLSYGGDRFDGGVSLSEQQQQQIERDKAQDDRLKAILDRLDAMTAAQPK